MSIKGNGTSTHIPVIDISNVNDEIGENLVEAASKWGFIYISSHGLDMTAETVNRAFDISQEFFQLPQTEKRKYTIGSNNRGWSGPHREILDPGNHTQGDDKEAFNLGEFRNGKAQQPLPETLAKHETELNEFYTQCHNLCMRLLSLLALGLKINSTHGGQDWFSSRHSPALGPSGRILRLLYYPASNPASTTNTPPTYIRAGAHTDYGTLTLLFQRAGQPGLEILPPTSPTSPTSVRTWTAVPVSPPGTENDPFPPILINIADLLDYWTEGLLKSTMHRVVMPTSTSPSQAGDSKLGGDRYSIAYFCHPVDDTELEAVPSALVQARKSANGGRAGRGYGIAGGKAITAQEHLEGRLAETYGWSKQKDPEQE